MCAGCLRKTVVVALEHGVCDDGAVISHEVCRDADFFGVAGRHESQPAALLGAQAREDGAEVGVHVVVLVVVEGRVAQTHVQDDVSGIRNLTQDAPPQRQPPPGYARSASQARARARRRPRSLSLSLSLSFGVRQSRVFWRCISHSARASESLAVARQRQRDSEGRAGRAA